MQLTDYKILIQNLPIRQQAFTAKKTTWIKVAEKHGLSDLHNWMNQLFEEDILQISRQDIFDTEDAKTKVLKTIIWGYPRGMRGNHFRNIFDQLPVLAELMKDHQGQNLRWEIYQAAVLPTFKDTPGLGLSTYSKLLYFFGLKIDDHPCLILDERLLRTFRAGQFEAFSTLATKPKYKPERWYADYLRIMDEQAKRLDTRPENLEQFLFLFGRSLKA